MRVKSFLIAVPTLLLIGFTASAAGHDGLAVGSAAAVLNSAGNYSTEGSNALSSQSMAQAPQARAASKKVCTGKVVDKAGQPIPGAGVIEVDSSNGVVTDQNGSFSINVAPGATLTVSCIGYKTENITVGTQNTYTITLSDDFEMLSETVVVGYGTMKKGEVASAISTVKSEEFLKTPGANAAELIKGKVPGLIINTPDGNPVSSTQISLRGATTLKAGTAPLVLIDGVPGSLSEVSSDDIEQIDVLKDGSAAAIYGTRGTNGVIIITTKNAQGEMAPTVDFNAYVSTQQITKTLNYLTADEYRSLAKGHVGFHDDGASVNWLDEITRTPLSQIYNISLRGGTKQTNYVASFEYRDLQGVMKLSDNKMMFPRIDVTHRMFDGKVKLHASVNGFKMKYHNGSDGGPYNSAVWNGLNYNPTTPVRQPDGSYSENTGITDYYNPVSLLNETKGGTDATMLRMLGDVTYTPIMGLDFKAVFSENIYNQTQGHYETHNHSYEARTPKGGFASRGTYRAQQDMLELTAQWKSNFGDGHNYTVLAGYSYLNNVSENYWMQNSGFAVDDYEYNNIGVGTQKNKGYKGGQMDLSSDKGEDSLIGFFARVNYNYKGRYMFAASIRREGSTKFGANNKWGNFYSVSAAWNIKDEAFMKNVDAVSTLKLRAGYGETGTEPSSRYMSLNTLTFSSNAYYNGSYIQTLKPAKNANPNLRWERKHEWNVGVDYGFLNDRIYGTIDWYNRKTLDLLWDYSVPCPPYIYSSMTANAGSIRNTGIEIGVTGIVFENKDFGWTTSVNYSHNRNILLSLSNDQFMAADYSDQGSTGEPMQQSTHRLQVGQPLGNFFGFKSVDIDETGHWIIEGEDGQPKPILDQQPTDKKILGNGIPSHYLNWNNNLRWKGFDFGLQIRGAFGFEILNLTAAKWATPTMLTRGNVLKSAFDKVYGKAVLADDQPCQYVSYYVEKGDYVKIDNITLGYTFNFNKPNFKNLRVFTTIRNAATITGYSGIDPELSVTGLAPGVDNYTRYPATRSYTLGVSLKF
mgnify:CR=1 FL=1